MSVAFVQPAAKQVVVPIRDRSAANVTGARRLKGWADWADAKAKETRS